MCWSAPTIPKMAALPPPPTAQSPDVVNARNLSKKRQALAAGRQSTILTGPMGTTSSAPAYGKTLLGG